MIGFYKKNYHWVLSSGVLLTATAYFVFQKNYEFLIYAVTLAFLIGFLFFADGKFKFLKSAKWGFLIWMVLHMAGGSVYIKSTRLYDLMLIPLIDTPYQVLKYDQFVHFFCYLVMTGLIYSILKTITREDCNKITFSIILILASSSIGAINEIIEFSAVVLFSSSGVGGYYNTLIDLIANLSGAIVAALILTLNQKRSTRHSI